MDVEELELEFKLDENVSVKVLDNVLDSTNNIVTLVVKNELGKEEIYTLFVYKEEEVTNAFDELNEYIAKVDVNDNKNITVDIYKIQILSVISFLLMALIFALIFQKKKD